MLRNLILLTFLGFAVGLNAQTVFRVTANGITTEYGFEVAEFGGQLPDSVNSYDLILANNGVNNSQGCDTILPVTGKIVLVDRGTCSFIQKALKAQRAGAVMAIICNNQGGDDIFPPGGFDPAVTIPTIMVGQNDCIKIKMNLSGSKAKFIFEDPTNDTQIHYYEDFDSGPDGWTTKGLSNASDTFVWTKNGVSNGVISYVGGLGSLIIDAPSKNNGSMLFDAAFLTTQGDTNNIPGGPAPYARRYGELISPVINCSTFNSVTLKFFEAIATLNSFDNGTSSYATSIDGGATWSNPVEINTDLQPNETTPRGKFLKIELPQLANQAQARIKFIFDSDFYAWIIDDVYLLGKSPVDIEVQDKQFFFPFNYATPASQITTDTSTFSANLANLGSLDISNLTLRAQLFSSTGALLHNDSLVIANLPSGARDTTFSLPKSFVPGKLDPGVYFIVYSVEPPPGSPDDADPTNNVRIQEFIVTTNLYSKDDGLNTSQGIRAANGGDYFFGNLYYTSTDWNANDKFSASNVTFGAFMVQADGMLKGKSVTIYLAELLPSVDRDFNNFDVNKAITDNPDQIKIVGFATHEFTEDQSEIAEETLLDFVNFTDNVPLKKGTRYLLGVSYKDAASKAYHFIESDIQYYYIGTLLYAGGQWGGSSDAPVMRMELEISTPVDEVALPEQTLQLMPNPASDYIRAQVNFDKLTNANFVIADINGRVLQLHTKKGVLKETFEFDTHNLAPGTYLMRISTDDGTKTKKFIIQR
ncbi:MAG TPA: T9SS type A sorting domain-containing protein [Saprospiraceae bacterium]|nr:T9SS type A sorting domain-containing protein [Saprospiraceae bacterium]HNT20382.1 T9SS type A sorting domain-containing protein [Saprospiraceae bacterium]